MMLNLSLIILSGFILSWSSSSLAVGGSTCRLVGNSAELSTQFESLGYTYQVDRNLRRFDFWSLRSRLNQHYAVEIRGPNINLFFRNDDGGIFFLSYKQNELPTCTKFKEQLLNFSKDRKIALKAAQILTTGQGSVLQSLLDMEQVLFRRAGRAVDPTAAENVKLIFEAVRARYNSTANLPYFERLNELRKVFIRSGLRRYCRDLPNLLDLGTRHCTNCVGQTSLILASYLDLGFSPPEGWAYGFSIYKDHVQPLLFHAKNGTQIDLLSNEVSRSGKENILKASELLRLGLSTLRPLALRSDPFDLQNYQYLYRKFGDQLVLNFNSRTDSSEITLGGQGRIDLYRFTDVRSYTKFQEGPVPELADLSNLERAAYATRANEPRLSEWVNNQLPQLNDGSTDQLPPSDRDAAGLLLAEIKSFLEQLENHRRDLHPNELQILASHPRRELTIPDVLRISATTTAINASRVDRINSSNLEKLRFQEITNILGLANSRQTFLRPFLIEVARGELPVTFFFAQEFHRLPNGSPGQTLTVYVDSEQRKQELLALPLKDRYLQLIHGFQQQIDHHLISDLGVLNEYFRLTRPWEFRTGQNQRWQTSVSRIQHLYVTSKSLASLVSTELVKNIFTGYLPHFEKHLKTRVAFSQALAKNPKETLDHLAALTSEQRLAFFNTLMSISSENDFSRFFYVFLANLYGYEWEFPLADLFLRALYDRRHLFAPILTPQEKTELSAFIKTMPTPSSGASRSYTLPELELPQMSISDPCPRGQSVQSGSFVIQCPRLENQNSGDPTQPEDQALALKIIEHPTDLWAQLMILNYRLLFHPGHLILFSRIFTEELDQEVPKQIELFKRRGLWKLAFQYERQSKVWEKSIPYLLSKHIPEYKPETLPLKVTEILNPEFTVGYGIQLFSWVLERVGGSANLPVAKSFPQRFWVNANPLYPSAMAAFEQHQFWLSRKLGSLQNPKWERFSEGSIGTWQTFMDRNQFSFQNLLIAESREAQWSSPAYNGIESRQTPILFSIGGHLSGLAIYVGRDGNLTYALDALSKFPVDALRTPLLPKAFYPPNYPAFTPISRAGLGVPEDYGQ